MLEHEAEHARSGDPYLRSTALLALILMPWNPAIWWAMRRMRLAVEIDCDRRVLRRGVDPRHYASLLLAVGERMSATPFAWATALGDSRSSLEQRILAMSNHVDPRQRKLAIAALCAGILGVIAIACASPVPDPVVPSPAAATQEHAKAIEVRKPWLIGDSIMVTYVCKDTQAARADSTCVNESRFYAFRGVRGGELQPLRDSIVEIRDEPVTGEPVMAVKEYRADRSIRDDLEVPTRTSTSVTGYPITTSAAREEPSLVLQNTTPKCTAEQRTVWLHAKAGQSWPRCEP